MKILIKIKDNKLEIINRKKLNTEYKNMLNTNIISNDELVFSDEYIKQNTKLLVVFLNELIKNYNLNTISFQNNEVASLFITFIDKIKYVKMITFEDDEALPYTYANYLIKSNNIKLISAKIIPKYLFELLNKYGIIAESREETLFTSNFMKDNALETYTSIYYKYSIYLKFPFTNNDYDDFNAFCNINQKLKNININNLDKESLEKIIKILIDNKYHNIKIILNGNITDNELIEYLKRNNKILYKKYKYKFKIKYSNKYIKKNILKQTNLDILKSIGLIALIIVLIIISSVLYDNYKSITKVNEINNKIDEILETENTTVIENEETNIDIPTKSYLYSLKNVNSDIVGWLKVNNTNIDYAVVQSSDNNYYLNHNLYKEKDSSGWLFLDYRNNANTFDDNNIIYGHNRYLNGVMFGTLSNTLKKEWYTNKDNLIISYDTYNGSFKFEVFSIYVVDVTTDYLQTNFDDVQSKLDFINLIKNRSIYDFGIEVNENDKIITLSTCKGDHGRLVVHAKLIQN